MPPFLPLLPLLLFLLSLPYPAHSANPVHQPIIPNALHVVTRRFARLPLENGNIPRINSITHHARNLYATTSTKIYRISPSGNATLWFDVDAAIYKATSRRLNFANPVHGGLRSLAFHPSFSTNHLFYLSAMEDRPPTQRHHRYISDVPDPIPADSVLLEFRCHARTHRPIPSTYRNLFRVGMPVFDHPIKQIAFFGNNLYIAHGDGSVQSAVAGGGQRNDALGKILRINPVRNGSRPYRIPRTNPFRRNPRMPSEVYAIGFRNPHTICFAQDGTLFAADAGRANVEEVNVVLKGRNYGWSRREGTFVHRGGAVGGRLLWGVRELPMRDAENGFEYPVAQVGHEGEAGAGFIGQAIAGGCPVQNGSPMGGGYYYSDFPVTGRLYFSQIAEMKRAVTRGDPQGLTQARTMEAVVWLDDDGDEATPPRRVGNLGGALRAEREFKGADRVDVRFGMGSRGELYWSSKTSGTVYLFVSSVLGAERFEPPARGAQVGRAGGGNGTRAGRGGRRKKKVKC